MQNCQQICLRLCLLPPRLLAASTNVASIGWGAWARLGTGTARQGDSPDPLFHCPLSGFGERLASMAWPLHGLCGQGCDCICIHVSHEPPRQACLGGVALPSAAGVLVQIFGPRLPALLNSRWRSRRHLIDLHWGELRSRSHACFRLWPPRGHFTRCLL